MRRSRAVRPTPSMSLFPFLAVLICTMGVLIILLVLVTREANLNAEAQAQESAEDRDARVREVQNVIDREQLRASMLSDLQPDLQQRLSDARLRRSHLEDQIRELEEKSAKLKAQLRAITEEPDDSTLIRSKQELTRLQQEIDQAERSLNAEREQVQELQRSYAVVPYPGPNGTTRRPIYLECSSEGIRLQPHDVLFTSRELHQPVLAGNPLDAALLAVREYWARYGKENEEPYPLLIVRPDGATAYAMAREAMKSWDSEFGYELVDRDVPLQFPGEDPELAQHLREVVAAACEKQAVLQAAIAKRERQQLLATGDQGGAGRYNGSGDQAGDQRGFASGGDAGSGDGDSGNGNMTLRATRRRGGFVVENDGGTRGGRPSGNFPAGSGDRPAWEIDAQGNVRLRGSDNGENGGTGDADTKANAGNGQVASPSQSSPAANDRNSGNIAFTRPQQGSGQPNLQTSPQGRMMEMNGPRDAQQPSQQPSNGSVSQQGMSGNSESENAQQATLGMASLSESRGDNWALPSKSPQATAFRKPIQLTCTAQRLTIYPGSYSTEPVRSVDFSGPTSQHMDELVDGVWRLIDSWGSAGYNAFWKPELHIRVGPDGEQRFRELQALLEDSGIDIKRKSP